MRNDYAGIKQERPGHKKHKITKLCSLGVL